ncbi:MAG: nuclear transport factor 2 family protein [Actinobacteria bacterium]|nr:nuclear transport factor 2 family protein [Actinomycetota bacterium]
MDRHFAAENAHDVEGTLATYTDDIVWDDVTHPEAPFHGKEEVGKVYSSILEFGADSEGNRGGIATTQTLGLGRGPLLGPLGSWAISRK